MKYHDRYLSEIATANQDLAKALDGFRDQRVLVTGASGIIGFAVAKTLERFGADLVLCSRSPGNRAEGEFSAAVSWRHGAVVDILAPEDRFDAVFHCATYGQPQKFTAEWRETIRLNVDTVFALLEKTEKLGFASTTEIYSGITVATTEEMVGLITPQHPRSAYVESKRVGESICFNSGKGVANRIALAAGPYPRPDDARALYQIVRRARDAGEVRLLGGAHNIRQYQYSFACASRFIVTTGYGIQCVYNNAGPYMVSMRELGEAIARHIGVAFTPGEEGAGVAGAPSVVKVDCTRTSNEFPYLADIDPSFDDFLSAVIEATRDG